MGFAIHRRAGIDDHHAIVLGGQQGGDGGFFDPREDAPAHLRVGQEGAGVGGGDDALGLAGFDEFDGDGERAVLLAKGLAGAVGHADHIVGVDDGHAPVEVALGRKEPAQVAFPADQKDFDVKALAGGDGPFDTRPGAQIAAHGVHGNAHHDGLNPSVIGKILRRKGF